MEKQFVAFKVDSSCYCIDIMEVQEVIRESQITTMPNFPSFVEGVINLRGIITPILSINKRLKTHSQAILFKEVMVDDSIIELAPPSIKNAVNKQPLKLIVVKIGSILLGLLVDTLDKILTIDEQFIQNAEGLGKINSHKMVAGIIHTDDDIYTVLNPKYILESEETQRLTETLK